MNDTFTKKKAVVFFGLVVAVLTIVVVFPPTGIPAWACGRCWNVTIGETIDGIMVDRTGNDAGYAIEMSCTTLNKPDPPGSTLNLACEENYNDANVRYADSS